MWLILFVAIKGGVHLVTLNHSIECASIDVKNLRGSGAIAAVIPEGALDVLILEGIDAHRSVPPVAHAGPGPEFPREVLHPDGDLSPGQQHGAGVLIEATVRTTGKTGVEMEALTAVSAAALTIYDMCKAVDRSMRISDIRLAQKRGGRSGEIVLEE